MFHVAPSRPRARSVTLCDAPPASGPASRPAGEGIAPCLQEVFVAGDAGGSGVAFALGQIGAARPGALLWVQDRAAMRHAGIPYPPGLPPLGGPLFHVLAGNARDLLFAMEEGLRCSAIAAVIGELSGDPPALDFTATRRLAVACERSGVPAFLLRHAASANLSGARERWRIVAAPSPPNPWNAAAPGPAAMDAELFRSRTRAPAQWRIAHDHAANRLDQLADAGAGTLAADLPRRSGG